MPILDTDLVLHHSLSRPEDDDSVSGGAIDPDHRADFSQLAANDTVEALSDSAGDTTQTVTITGRDPTGKIVSEAQALNGTTAVAFATTLERVLKVVMDADATGTVTVRRAGAGPTVGTIPPGERGFAATFIDSASETGAVSRYEKLHWLNSHGSLTLNNAEVTLTADPESRIQIGLESAKDDAANTPNRRTAPTGVAFVDDSVTQSVPGTTLEAGSSIGFWAELGLLAADPPKKNTYTTQLSGTSV